MSHKITTIAISTALGLSLFTAVAEDKALDASKLPPASTATDVTYDKDIKPIFEKSCVKCHKGDKAKGKLQATRPKNALECLGRTLILDVYYCSCSHTCWLAALFWIQVQ